MPLDGEPWGGTFWKGKPQMAERDELSAKDEERDRVESVKVKARSKGRCEVTIAGVRCKRRAFEVHHHKGGWKVRGRGDSALAQHKTHACSDCHRLITGKVLKHVRANIYKRAA